MASSGYKSKQKKVHALHQKQKVFREANPVLSVVIWGVNYTMRELQGVAEQPLIMAPDFKSHSKVSVHNQNYNDQWLPAKFKFKAYCPVVFRDLRERFGIAGEDVEASVCDMPLISLGSPGKSGATFYSTHDNNFVLKVLGREEVASFHQTFPAYHAHMVESCAGDARTRSLLPQYVAMYRVTVKDKETYFCVMRSIHHPQLPPTRTYDLKGSTVARSASDKEKAKEHPIQKDNDFKENGEGIALGADLREQFLASLAKDIELLMKLKFMDYSLLVSIHELTEDSPKPDELEAHPYLFAPPDSKVLYGLGIIDVLTKYNAKKKAAHTAKGVRHGPHAEISTVNAEKYGQRFLEFMKSISS